MIRSVVPRLVLAFVGVVVLSGCWSGLRRGGNPFDQDEEPSELQLDIENQNFADATVYASRGGQPIRVGVVSGKSDSGFTLDWDFALDLSFRVDLIGGGSCATRPMPVNPGETIRLRIPANVAVTQCQAWK